MREKTARAARASPASHRPRKPCHKKAAQSRSPRAKHRAAGMAVRKLSAMRALS